MTPRFRTAWRCGHCGRFVKMYDGDVDLGGPCTNCQRLGREGRGRYAR